MNLNVLVQCQLRKPNVFVNASSQTFAARIEPHITKQWYEYVHSTCISLYFKDSVTRSYVSFHFGRALVMVLSAPILGFVG